MIDWSTVPTFGSDQSGFAAIVRPSAYAILVDVTQRIAVVETPVGMYLPGGGQEPGESMQETIVREAREECALQVQPGLWQVHAVEHVDSVSENLHFEKRSTFVEAAVLDVLQEQAELDHRIVWMTVADALLSLTPLSHRWAVSEWAAR